MRRSGNRLLLQTMAVVSLILATSGCRLAEWYDNGFKVGPNYARPAAPVASEWIDYQDPRLKSEEQALSEWWRVFNDPVLNSLAEEAYSQNLSLRVAGARILEARALRGIAVGELFPQDNFSKNGQQAFGDFRHQKYSQLTANSPPDVSFDNWHFGLETSWELDIWGRYRRSIEAADAELDASVEQYDDVLVLLLADVARSYVQYRIFEQRLYYARSNVAIQEKAAQLTADKFSAGVATERDVQQARQVLEQTRALIPQFEIGKRFANNQLCVLLGMPPVDLATKLGAGQQVPTVPTEVVVGIPADLIRRRPDVRFAERQVAAQSAKIGIATSDLYPHFYINGLISLEAENLADITMSPESMTGVIGPRFEWSILHYGRIRNRIRFHDARFEELAFAYQQKVLTAGREVEDAMISFLRSQQRANHVNESTVAAARTVQITNDQYRLGAVDFTPVYIFQSVLTTQQDQLAVAQGDIALSLIEVYRALGGGWDLRLRMDGAGHHDHGPIMPPGTAPPAASAAIHDNELPEPEVDPAPVPPAP